MNDPGEERVAIVDRHNHPVGVASRAEVRVGRLIHRATYIFVFGRDGRLFLQRRTATKDMYPGYYDAAAGGVLKEGEDYDESARREAEEELGLVAPLRPHGEFYFEDPANRVWGRIYSCVSDGPFRLQPEEVASGCFVDVEDVVAGRYQPLTPDTLMALQHLRALASG